MDLPDQAAEKVMLPRLLKKGQMQVELCEIPLCGGSPACAEASAGRRNPSQGTHICVHHGGVRRNKPAPCLTRGRMRAIPRLRTEALQRAGAKRGTDGRFSATC